MEKVLSAGTHSLVWQGWGGRYFGVELPKELSWGTWSRAGAEREADARVQIRKCVRVNRCRYFCVFKFFSCSPLWSLGNEEGVGSENEEEKRNNLAFSIFLCLTSTDL